jgi:hypothetical protein
MSKHFSINRNSEHAEKSAERDIRVMAQRLSRSESIIPHSGRTVKHVAIDVAKVGAMRIAGKAIPNFNRTVCSADFDYLEGDKDKFDEEDEHEDSEIDDDIDEDVGHFFVTGHDD